MTAKTKTKPAAKKSAKATKLPVPRPSAKQQAASAARKATKPAKPTKAALSISTTGPLVIVQKPSTKPAPAKIKRLVALASVISSSRLAMPAKSAETSKEAAPSKDVRKIRGKVAVIPAQPEPAKPSLVELSAALDKTDPGELPEFLRRSPGVKPAQIPPAVSRETEPKASTVNPAAKQAQRAEAEKAVAENGHKVVRIAPLTTGLHAKPPKPAKPAADKPKPAEGASKPGKPKERSATGYDWSKAEALVKAGKLPPAPQLKSYGPHMQAVHDYAFKGDLKALSTYMGNFKDEKGGRANLFRYARLCGYKS